ncbi:hypothetical protein TNCT_248351 [Trichonephila clavata]|uniref:Uncharacterized protein n=1 Tax=Trichonephila clavata TaxID=2740835 RepID=A0A8X6IPB1_TRICU|nr:hypothetical protein TNCT_248351 [Trichonephila clavata]
MTYRRRSMTAVMKEQTGLRRMEGNIGSSNPAHGRGVELGQVIQLNQSSRQKHDIKEMVPDSHRGSDLREALVISIKLDADEFPSRSTLIDEISLKAENPRGYQKSSDCEGSTTKYLKEGVCL